MPVKKKKYPPLLIAESMRQSSLYVTTSILACPVYFTGTLSSRLVPRISVTHWDLLPGSLAATGDRTFTDWHGPALLDTRLTNYIEYAGKQLISESDKPLAYSINQGNILGYPECI